MHIVMKQARKPTLLCHRLARAVTLLVAAASVCLFASGPTALGQVAPIAYWAFDEGSGTIALDSSTNNNLGTIVGATYVAGRFGSAYWAFDEGSGTIALDSSTNNNLGT